MAHRTGPDGPDAAACERLLREIEAEMRATAASTGEGRLDPRVADALRRVPRQRFVPPDLAHRAWDNTPLPIGRGQTVSQPFIVALMTQLLRPRPTHRMLEVGAGSGYQAAVLAELVDRVVTLERIAALADAARRRLAGLGYGNVEVHVADGRTGWPEAAPYDGILVAAAAREIPEALVEQLAPGGRLVIPVGGEWGQELVLVEKGPDGGITRRRVLPVAFVPLLDGLDGVPAYEAQEGTKEEQGGRDERGRRHDVQADGGETQ